MEWTKAIEWLVLPGVFGLIGWNVWLSKELVSIRIAQAREYHNKADVDAIVNRLMVAMSKQIKSDLAPVKFRLREISRALKLPPEIEADDEDTQ